MNMIDDQLGEYYIRLTRALAIIMAKFPMGIPYERSHDCNFGIISFSHDDRVRYLKVELKDEHNATDKICRETRYTCYNFSISLGPRVIELYSYANIPSRDIWDHVWSSSIVPYSADDIDNEVYEFVCDYFIDGEK